MINSSKNSLRILHYPKLDSILMVEKAIQESEDYPTRMELWKSLPKQMQYQTFKLILEYLENSNKIMFEEDKIIWIFANNKKLNKLIQEANYKKDKKFRLNKFMIIKEVKARAVLDSRKEKTIQIIIKTPKRVFKTSAPEGKSVGKYEAKPYLKNLNSDIKIINSFDISKFNKLNISSFSDLLKVERLIKNKIGANSLYALEASMLKALAYENKKELWEFLSSKSKPTFPRPIGNAIGGGLHSKGIDGKKPDFQEFLFISDSKTVKECVETNNLAYKLMRNLLNASNRNDEGAWETGNTNEEVLEIMNEVKETIRQKYNQRIEIGVDVASSSFYKKGFYEYKNPKMKLNKQKQIDYLFELIKRYNLFYIEDGLEENDFAGFASLTKKRCFIVGDDLTATNPKRLKQAISMKSINAIIVKPNQIGSLIKVKEVIDLAKENNIKTIISHRSGETKDNTIADLGVGWDCDFIKTGIYGSVREAKLKRVMRIERKMKIN